MTEDYNGAQQEGFGRLQPTIRDGRRCSAAVAYLRPALGAAESHGRDRRAGDAGRVRRSSRRRRRVSRRRRAATRARRARGAPGGGVINSPQLLMLSGIGDPGGARAHGIAVRVAAARRRPQSAGPRLGHRRLRPQGAGSAAPKMRPTGSLPELARAYFAAKASQRSAGRDHGIPEERARRAAARHPAPVRRRADDGSPLLPAVLPALCRQLRLPRRGVAAGKPRPASARLGRSARAAASGRISSRPRRTGRLARRACAWSARSARAGALRRLSRREIAPGPNAGRRETIDAHIRATAITVHHPLGTCKMGGRGDPTAWSIPSCRVKGVERAARRRCLGDAGSGRRQHQRAGHHDRREGGGSDPRSRAARARQRVTRSAVTQNIYDNEEFFEGYSRLPRSVAGLDGAPEWPALRALLPDLQGLAVLDLGCGFGWFCRWARQQVAARVLGIDVSEKMLARAAADTRDRAVTYIRADMEQLELPPETFDLVYSSPRPALCSKPGGIGRGCAPGACRGREPGVLGRASDLHGAGPAGLDPWPRRSEDVAG